MRARWEALHAALDRSVRSLQAEQAFQQARQHPALARFDQPFEVVEYLASKGGDLDEKDRLLGVLVTLVQRREHHELVSGLLWLGLWPGLDAVYRRRQRNFRGQPEELIAELADVFTGIIERLDLKVVHRVSATLVRSTARDLIDRRRRVWADADRIVYRDTFEPVRDQDDRIIVASHLDRLARAEWEASQAEAPLGLTQGLSFEDDVAELRVWLTEIIGADAELLLAVLVLDENQREAAQRLGLSHDAARKRFQRALGRLREHLASSLSHSDLAGRVCLPTNRMNRPEEPTA